MTVLDPFLMEGTVTLSEHTGPLVQWGGTAENQEVGNDRPGS